MLIDELHYYIRLRNIMLSQIRIPIINSDSSTRVLRSVEIEPNNANIEKITRKAANTNRTENGFPVLRGIVMHLYL